MLFKSHARRLRVCALFFLTVFGFTTPVVAQSQDINALKAAYIFNFSKFITWNRDSDEIIICLDTENRWIFRQLKGLEGKTVNSKPFRVQTITIDEQTDVVNECHVLYMDKPLGDVKVDLRGVLVVSDSMNPESIISFLVKEGRLTFEINAERADAQDVVISSRLLRLAKKVYQ